jgi:hypothetical protein
VIKSKTLFVATLVLFILVNTTYYWEGILGAWMMPLTLLFIIVFLILSVCLIHRLFLVIKGTTRERSKVYITIITMIFWGLIFIKPFGIINFDKLNGKDLFVAARKGSASCGITFKLKERNKFILREVCFGIASTNGTYKLKNDTIIVFDHLPSKNGPKAFEFGIIGTTTITLYKSKQDSIPIILAIISNNL